ncbi:MAG TPA: cupredoxin domain-containing protein [Kofleriaceae bacterium]|nr:cupredoxin domain-containing protein [Kofleriaceae bacterium]
MVEHDQSIINDETRLVGELGLASWLAADVVLPFRVFDTHIHYLDPMTGKAVQIEDPTLHHRNEVLVGPGDPWLVARVATTVRDITLSARLGTTIPIGSTVPDPFVLGDLGISHEHTQFGTGTFVPIAGVEAYRTFGGVTVDAYVLTLQSLYENGYGYKPGNRYAVGLGAASDLGTTSWRFRTTLERSSETAESWSGVVNTSEGNIGRSDIIAGVEAAYRVNEDWRASLALKLPLYTHVVGGQVDTPVYVALTVSTHADLWKPKHVRPPPISTPSADWTGLDKQDPSTDGAAVPLVPVLGKITVYDFWADWCQPCGELDRELAEVARRHPDDIAVRKINVIDDDSPSWHTYLAAGGFSLPHVKLFGRDGKLVWERTGAPPMLAAGVEDAITGAHVEPEGPTVPAVEPEQPPPTEPQPPSPPLQVKPVPPKPMRVAITVTDAGYSPARVEIPRGRSVVLVFTRKSEKTCAVDVHFTLPNGTKIDRRLPLGQAVEIPIRIDRAVEIPFACGMDMVHGTIVAK